MHWLLAVENSQRDRTVIPYGTTVLSEDLDQDLPERGAPFRDDAAEEYFEP